MNMAKALALILVFLTLMVPGALWAGDGKDAYVVLKGGGYFPESSDLKDQDAKTGFVGQVGFGYYLLPILSLEVAGGYFGTKGNMENTFTFCRFRLARCISMRSRSRL